MFIACSKGGGGGGKGLACESLIALLQLQDLIACSIFCILQKYCERLSLETGYLSLGTPEGLGTRHDHSDVVNGFVVNCRTILI